MLRGARRGLHSHPPNLLENLVALADERTGCVEVREHRVQCRERMERDGDCDGAGMDLLADRDTALDCLSDGSRSVQGR